MNWGMLAELIKDAHTIIIPLFICVLIWRADMKAFREFIDALHCPGASVLVGYVLVITGVVMMKIMLVDDGKYIIGGGAGILAKSLSGGSAPSSVESAPVPTPAAATEGQ